MLCVYVCMYMYYFPPEVRSIATQWYGGCPGTGFTNSTSYDTVSYRVLFVISTLVAPDMPIRVLITLTNGTRNPFPGEHSPLLAAVGSAALDDEVNYCRLSCSNLGPP